MKASLTILLLSFAPFLLAQDVLLPEDSMRDAWSEDKQQFDSLSNEPYGQDDSLSRDYSSSSDYGRGNRGDLQSSGNNIELDNNDGMELKDDPELDEY